MNSKNVINVGVSSAMIELKAELLKKKSEVSSTSGPTRARPILKNKDSHKKTSKKYIPSGNNPGLEQRVRKDLKTQALEEKTLEKSKAMLIAKAEIYDQLKTTALDYDEKEHPVLASSLVDFQRKALENKREELRKTDKVEEEYVVNEDEWTEFTDALGRTRRCLKTDLPFFTANSDELSKPTTVFSPEEQARLKMHDKWNEDMEKVNAKSEIHYQDIHFDEVRSHGVSYYEFSKDNETREEQIRGLKKMSEQTKVDRSKVVQVKQDRKQQIKERLKKIRQRKRAKLGLPPEEDKPSSSDEEDKNINEDETAEEEDEMVPATKPGLPPPMRAWDFGKPGVFGPRPTTMEELDVKWLIDRRADRNSEFAPPPSYSANFVRGSGYKPSSSTHPSKSKRSYEPIPSRPPQLPQRISDELPAPAPDLPERGLGAEVAPPLTFDYFHGERGRGMIPRHTPRPDSSAVSDAIAEGLRIIREQAERNVNANKEQ